VRVLTVTNLYPPAYEGGYELNCRGVMERLRADGHVVRILVGDPPIDPALRDDPDVHRAFHVYWRGEDAVGLNPLNRLRLERENRVTLRRHLRDFTPDVVSWWGMGGMSLSLVEQVRRARIPAVAFICDDWLDYARISDAWTRMFAGRRTFGWAVDLLTGLPTSVDWDAAAVYVFVSEFLRRESPPFRRAVVENPGIDAEFQIARPVRPWAGRLLTLGRMDPRKGFATAIEALALLPEATLTIAGGGPETEISRLREVASRSGVGERVTWLGPQERAVLPDLYAAHDVVLFPVVWEEPFGLVALEAMGIGRPVIATGRGGSAEYLRDGENCLLHPAQDAAALANAVCRIGGDMAMRSRLRDGGLVTAARLTSERYERAAIRHLRAASRT
jgi:glycogen(starch) synthase